MLVPVFGQEVQSVTYESSVGIWCAETSEFKFMCRWLIIATGENAVPAIPDIAGLGGFQGRLLHSSNYTNGAEFKGSKILAVGCGNSGMEVSLDLCNRGAQVSLVVRDKDVQVIRFISRLPIVPKGALIFTLSMKLLKWFPLSSKTSGYFLILCSELILGNTNRLGIDRPKAGPLELKIAAGKTPVLDVGAIA
uniref:indole-3-pyruvate monooxygenase n=1 Tax=Coffea canephora TaxID=49390 RepID=I6M4F6_COFCA|nr:hypothetical protein 111018.7 [Coffea canephora]